MRALRTVSLIAVLAATLLVAAAAAFVVGVRNRNPAVLRFARTFQRDLANPRVLLQAGKPGSLWSIIRHTGRSSGREYETPVEAVPFDGGFFVALVYGEQAQWVRNLRAGGAAAVVHDGAVHRVEHVEVVPIAQTPLAESSRAAIAIMGIESAVRLTTNPAD